MKFHEWPETNWKTPWREPDGSLTRFATPIDYWKDMCQKADSVMNNQTGSALAQTRSMGYQAVMNLRWWMACRPYYKVWPSILASLLKLKLDLVCNELNLPFMNPICIRTAGVSGCDLECVMIWKADDFASENGLLVAWTTSDTCFCPGPFRMIEGRTLEWFFEYTMDNMVPWLNGIFRVDEDAIRKSFLAALKIGVSVLLLAGDPNIIQPDVLSKDRQRFDNLTDPEERQRLIDKARKRRIVGFRVGEQYESIPHYRRPHPALFHTGKGRTVPRIVFRSGCVVHRDKMTKVPTGYITPEGVEVES